MAVYFVRHGETLFNVLRMTAGQMDVPLNENGYRQAEAAAEKLKAMKIDAIIASPLIRCKYTAQSINRFHGLEIIYDSRLKEFNAGQMQGKDRKTIDKEWEKAFRASPEKFGGESYAEFYSRVSEALDSLDHEGKSYLIVGHAGVGNVLLMHANKDYRHPLEKHKAYIGNCDIFVLKGEKKEGMKDMYDIYEKREFPSDKTDLIK